MLSLSPVEVVQAEKRSPLIVMELFRIFVGQLCRQGIRTGSYGLQQVEVVLEDSLRAFVFPWDLVSS